MKKVEISCVDTSKLKILSNKEKKELIEIIKGDDKKQAKIAREKFINGNLRLVLSVVGRFSNRGENMDDLFQVGCIGLIKAIDNFDTSHGVLFSTYAVPMIIGELRRYLRDTSSIRVSRSMRDIAYKALSAKETLTNEKEKDPSIEEISDRLNMKKSDVVIALDSIMDPVSLYDPIFSDGGDVIYVMDQIRDKNNTDENWLDELSIKDAIYKLNEREKNILSLRFFHGMTQTEVANEIGISQAQVSRLEKNAIDNIKNNI